MFLELAVLGYCHFVVCDVFRASSRSDTGKEQVLPRRVLHSAVSMVCSDALWRYRVVGVLERVTTN